MSGRRREFIKTWGGGNYSSGTLLRGHGKLWDCVISFPFINGQFGALSVEGDRKGNSEVPFSGKFVQRPLQYFWVREKLQNK